MEKRADALTQTALRCLLDGAPGEVLVAATDTGRDPQQGPISGLDSYDHVALDKLAARLRRARGRVRVVVVPSIDAGLTRAISDAAPALVVVTGELSDAQVHALTERTLLLGPRARLRVHDQGEHVLCAPSPQELAGLLGAVQSVRLALCPTPQWLPDWLDSPELAGTTAVGYVPAGILNPRWVTWSHGLDARHVLVPVGVPVDQPRVQPLDPDLDRLVAAHGLERYTGPVFPSPQVLALVAAGAGSPAEHPGDGRDIWLQARRALPFTGAALGMDAPEPELGPAAPAAAFLAQRCRQRRRARCELVTLASAGSTGAPSTRTASEALERSLEVLRASAPTLSEHETKVVLRGFGFEITRQALASSASGAAHYADLIGYPVVLKAIGPDLTDRGRHGLVELDLPNAAAVKRAYSRIVQRVEEEHPTCTLDGVLVSEMAPPGLDIHCGAARLASGEVAIYGRAIGQVFPIEQTFALAPLAPAQALLLADAVLSKIPAPALRRASDPQPAMLATVFELLSSAVETTGDRLVGLELDPLRVLDGERPSLVLDARMVQRAHLEGT
ncbi:MAG: hypothetical protein B7733_05295 [Myxococcales bacterium FL481]|nr:MAG: hypothetical protein B7733_05295 [Myxococcales bacterium FL481]